MPLTWIEQRLSEAGTTIQQLVEAENQRQAADQVAKELRDLDMLPLREHWRQSSTIVSIEPEGGQP